MSEMHLKQPGFTYDTFVILIKNKKQQKSWMKKRFNVYLSKIIR